MALRRDEAGIGGMIRMAAGAALLLASVCASAQTKPTIKSRYVIDQMEMAGGLQLTPHGRFRYSLDYGAVSEVSKGYWGLNSGTVFLTTDPMPPKAECDRGFASACFNRTPLTFEGENLILRRWDARIVLKPVQPRPR